MYTNLSNDETEDDTERERVVNGDIKVKQTGENQNSTSKLSSLSLENNRRSNAWIIVYSRNR